jgi:hypothetical protein
MLGELDEPAARCGASLDIYDVRSDGGQMTDEPGEFLLLSLKVVEHVPGVVTVPTQDARTANRGL